MDENPLEKLFARLESAHQEAIDIIQDLDPALVVHKDTGWTLKDLIAHIAVWEDEMIIALQTRQKDDTYSIKDVSPDDWDTYNNRRYLEHKNTDYDDIIQLWHTKRQAFITILRDFPEDQLYQRFTPPWNGKQEVNAYWLGRIAIGHEREHIEQIRLAARRASAKV